jgi:hypothetical protein
MGEAARLDGLKGDTGWAAIEQGKDEDGPKHLFDILQFKELCFELGFEKGV